MKTRVFAAALIMLLLFGIGCRSSGEDDNYSQVVEKVEKKELSGELSVRVYNTLVDEPMLLEKCAISFMKRYPEVTIRINKIDMPYVEGPSLDYLVTEANLAFASGEIEDIVDLCLLPHTNYIENGYLVDLYEYLNNDQEINQEDYYWDVIESAAFRGEMPGIILAFYKYYYTLDKYTLDKIGVDISERTAVTASEVLEWYNEAVERDIVGEEYLIGEVISSGQALLWEEIDLYWNREERTVSFTSEGFISLLEKMKQMGLPFVYVDEDEAETKEQPANIEYYYDHPMEKLIIPWYENVLYEEVWENDNKYLSQPLNITDSTGRVQVSTGNFYGISSICEEKELAWEFLKYCMDAEEWADVYTEDAFSGELYFGKHGNASISKKLTNDIYISEFGEKVAEALNEANEQISYLPQVDSIAVQEMIENCIRPYIEDDIGTAESVAQELQERMYFYLNE